MKKVFIFLFSSFCISAHSQPTAVVCNSFDMINGWTGVETFKKLKFTAYLLPGSEIDKAQLNGAYISDVRRIMADPNYTSKNPKYLGFNRFVNLEDAWCWFTPLLPKSIGSMASGSGFVGYVQMACEEGRNQRTIGMACFLK